MLTTGDMENTHTRIPDVVSNAFFEQFLVT